MWKQYDMNEPRKNYIWVILGFYLCNSIHSTSLSPSLSLSLSLLGLFVGFFLGCWGGGVVGGELRGEKRRRWL